MWGHPLEPGHPTSIPPLKKLTLPLPAAVALQLWLRLLALHPEILSALNFLLWQHRSHFPGREKKTEHLPLGPHQFLHTRCGWTCPNLTLLLDYSENNSSKGGRMSHVAPFAFWFSDNMVLTKASVCNPGRIFKNPNVSLDSKHCTNTTSSQASWLKLTISYSF